VATLLASDCAQRPAHGKGRREAWQHDTENVAQRWKRVRHGGLLQRRNGTVTLTHGDGGDLEQRRWHAASDRGGEAGEASDRGCQLRIQERVGRRLYGAGMMRGRVGPARRMARQVEKARLRAGPARRERS
jgi:hypothetical protein